MGNKPFLLRPRVCVLAVPFLADFKGVRKVQGPGIEGKGRGKRQMGQNPQFLEALIWGSDLIPRGINKKEGKKINCLQAGET